jgi:hypothetical protein
MAAPDQLLAEILLTDVDHLVDSMLQRVSFDISPDDEFPEDLPSEIKDWMGRIATVALQLVLRGESLEVLGPLMEQNARRRRMQNVSQEQSLRAYEVAQQALLDEVAERIHGHPDEAVLFNAFTRRLLEFQRVAALGVTAGFVEEGEPPPTDHDIQLLFERLIGQRAGADTDPGLATRLGIVLPLRVALATPRLEAAEAEARHLRRLHPWSVVGMVDDRIAVLARRPPRGMRQPHGTADIPDGAAPGTIAAAVTLAAEAADVAERLATPSLPAPAATPLAAILSLGETERQDYLATCFGDLVATPRGDAMLDTVSAVLTYPRAADAARALHIHRHTLDYRLQRFQQATGLDLADPASRFRAEIGLFLLGRLPHRT